MQSEVLVKGRTSWDGVKLPCCPQGELEVTVLRVIVPAKTQLPLHKHPIINTGYLVRGQLTVTMEDGRTRHMEAGDVLIETTDAWHCGCNDGDSDAEVIVFCVGSPGVPTTILKP